MVVVMEASCWSIFLQEVTIGDQVDDQGQVVFKDTSDASKNRLWSGVGIASFGEQGSIYYHVGDE